MKAVFDTNILIDYLQGSMQAQQELSNYTSLAISVITWMELLVGCKSAHEEAVIKSFLNRFEVIDISLAIREKAVSIRREMHIKLPDAIVLASARCLEVPLVTRNIKDFPAHLIDIRMPYIL